MTKWSAALKKTRLKSEVGSTPSSPVFEYRRPLPAGVEKAICNFLLRPEPDVAFRCEGVDKLGLLADGGALHPSRCPGLVIDIEQRNVRAGVETEDGTLPAIIGRMNRNENRFGRIRARSRSGTGQ